MERLGVWVSGAEWWRRVQRSAANREASEMDGGSIMEWIELSGWKAWVVQVCWAMERASPLLHVLEGEERKVRPIRTTYD